MFAFIEKNENWIQILIFHLSVFEKMTTEHRLLFFISHFSILQNNEY